MREEAEDAIMVMFKREFTDGLIDIVDPLKHQVRYCYSLCRTLSDLHDRWKQLLSVSYGFFQLCHMSMHSELIAAVCRMCDPEKSCGSPNLSLKKLVSFIRSGMDDNPIPPELLPKLEKNLAELDIKSSNLRNFRNKLLSHLDEKVAKLEIHIEDVNLPEIEEVLQLVVKCLDDIREHLYSPMASKDEDYRLGWNMRGSVDDLVNAVVRPT